MIDFWFLRDAEHSFCWQICGEISATRYTWEIDFGIGLDPARLWFTCRNPATRKATASLHWYWLSSWPEFRRWPQNEADRPLNNFAAADRVTQMLGMPMTKPVIRTGTV